MVDAGGRISVLTFRYHVGRHLSGCSVEVENAEGLFHVIHNGVLVATHAKRHLDDDDAKFEGRPKATRPAPPTTGTEVKRIVDHWGSVSFAATGYRVGNKFEAKRPASGLSAIRSRSRSKANWFALTGPDTTSPRSSGPWPSPTASRGGATMVSVATGAKAGHGCRTSTLWISQRRPRPDEGLKEYPKVFHFAIDDEDWVRAPRQLLRPVRHGSCYRPPRAVLTERYGTPVGPDRPGSAEAFSFLESRGRWMFA